MPLIALLATLDMVGSAPGATGGTTLSLFNGKTLAGWQVTGGEAAVQDGAILLKSGEGFVRTDHRYGDFVLELDWKPLKAAAWDSGIYFRSELPKPRGAPWPNRYQVNLKAGQEGNLIGSQAAKSSGLVKPGDWNHFKLSVTGGVASLEINGKPAWKVDGIMAADGYIGLQSEVTLGGQFLFKNIRITELGHEPLFNGRDLTGWLGAGSAAEACWKVTGEGELMCTGKRGPWLRSRDQYGDFNLRLEYQVRPGGNSGVYLRVPESGKHHGQGAGVEVQVLDDRHPRHAKLNAYQYCGSVYAVAPAREHVGRESGQWNSLEINAHGADYRVTHNGVVIVDAKASRFPQLAKRLRKGYLGLQNHSTEVLFRNLRIGKAMP